jgi:hypothetical protein
MPNTLTREFVQRACAETTAALLKVGILKPGEYLELADSGSTQRPIRLALFSEGVNERSTLLNECNLRRALDGLETLRATAYFAEFRLPRDQMLVSLDDGRQVALMYGEVQVRQSVAGTWSLPLRESPEPHVPGTIYRGEW